MRIISWNIDSLNAALTGASGRAQLSRDVLQSLADLAPDVLAIQETKLPVTGPSKTHLDLLSQYFPGYQLVWRSSEPPARKGYAGTLFLVRAGLDFQASQPAIGAPDTMDQEGRLLTLELPEVYITQVYTPNAGSDLVRLPGRQVWDVCYRSYLQELDQTKPVIAMGDFNCAHEEIDLAHPDNNHQSAGFTDEEREGFSQLLAAGFTDSFRRLHGPVEGVYSWWAQRVKTSKINNSGWRIDYFLVSDRIADQVEKSEMVDSGPRQDHAPILLEIAI